MRDHHTGRALTFAVERSDLAETPPGAIHTRVARPGVPHTRLDLSAGGERILGGDLHRHRCGLSFDKDGSLIAGALSGRRPPHLRGLRERPALRAYPQRQPLLAYKDDPTPSDGYGHDCPIDSTARPLQGDRPAVDGDVDSWTGRGSRRRCGRRKRRRGDDDGRGGAVAGATVVVVLRASSPLLHTPQIRGRAPPWTLRRAGDQASLRLGPTAFDTPGPLDRAVTCVLGHLCPLPFPRLPATPVDLGPARTLGVVAHERPCMKGCGGRLSRMTGSDRVGGLEGAGHG